MENKKQNAILYIEKTQGILYVGKESFTIRFPKDVISNGEVIDKGKLQLLFTNFITENKIPPVHVLLILSPEIIFEKKLSDMPLAIQHIEIEKFLDLVPFDSILTRTFRLPKKTTILVANKELCEVITDSLKAESCIPTGIVALNSLEEKLPSLKEKFDAQLILKKLDTFKSYNLDIRLEHQEKILSYKVPSLKNPQFIALISVFVLLFVILCTQVYIQLMSNKPAPTQAKQLEQLAPTTTSPSTEPSASGSGQ